MQVSIEEPFRQLFPEAAIGIVIASDIDNRRDGASARAALEAAVRETATVTWQRTRQSRRGARRIGASG